MHSRSLNVIARLGALVLVLLAMGAEAQPQPQPRPARPQTQSISVAASAPLNPLVEQAFAEAARAVEAQTRGTVQLSLRPYPQGERELLRRMSANQFEGVMLSQEGLVEACPGALALRTPRELSPRQFDSGLTAVREAVAQTCAPSLTPMMWFSSGERFLFARINGRSDGGASAGLRAPEGLSSYGDSHLSTAESQAFGISVGDERPQVALLSQNDIARLEADVPGAREERSVLLPYGMGYSLALVALGRRTLDTLSPEQRAAVETAFRDMEQRLTLTLRRAARSPRQAFDRLAQSVVVTRDERGLWQEWARQVEQRISESRDGAAPILRTFLDPPQVVAPTTDASVPTGPTVTFDFDSLPSALRDSDVRDVVTSLLQPPLIQCAQEAGSELRDVQALLEFTVGVRSDGLMRVSFSLSHQPDPDFISRRAFSHCIRQLPPMQGPTSARPREGGSFPQRVRVSTH